MSYSLDLRKRVVEYVSSGGSKAEASRVFSVSKWCVNEWCKRDNLKPISPPGRPRNKLDWDALKRDVQANPDRLLHEHAKKYGVRINAIWHACKKMGLSHKKNNYSHSNIFPYSSDFNPIEQDFAIIKKKRIYGEYASLDELVYEYGNILE